MSLKERIATTCKFISEKLAIQPEIGIILGSGLGGLVDYVKDVRVLTYHEIPGFPVSTVEGHESNLIAGTLGGKPVIMMSGRLHYYEGYSMEEVTFPVRIMQALGAHTLIVSNASGGMNGEFKVGDIMIITDHINLFPEHPLRGKNENSLGPRFPDMSEPYDLKLIQLAKDIAAEQQVDIRKGIYVGLQGPTFETRAEYHFLRVIGGDAVGMSTVPEVIVGIHGGMRIFGASIITDLGMRDELNKITHEEVLEAANAAAPKLAGIVAALIEKMDAP